ncbi:mechanosensitive ion channel family protein [Synechococcus sp. RSCCF101]|uniref:mechanosensitive ion channel family protein n=1 Tax=Synechococcus sp. RSCCF101 TaxID=2511069 RepID=UPI001248BE26|nr:mechanosensitive ion channel family protein [Synechococcus sp. RSCCF101]
MELQNEAGLETGWVISPVSGSRLFRIAQDVVPSRASSNEAPPRRALEERANRIESRIGLMALRRNTDLSSLYVGEAILNGETVVVATDQQRSRPLVIATVTDDDSAVLGLSKTELADEWSAIIDADIRRGRSVFSQENRVRRAGQILDGMALILGSGSIYVAANRRLRAREDRILKEQDALTATGAAQEADGAQAGRPASTRPMLLKALSAGKTPFKQALQPGSQSAWITDRRVVRLRLGQWLLLCLTLASAYLGVLLLMVSFPALAEFRRVVMGIPLKLLLLWFGGSLSIRVLWFVVDRLYDDLARMSVIQSSVSNRDRSERQVLRRHTITQALKGFIALLVVSICLLIGLGYLGVPTASVVAIGGLAGLALSFGSQSLVRDIVNGFTILAEDQYAVGDVIEIDDKFGVVENFGLRVTQLRSLAGEYISIPNSSIGAVKNLTRLWSRVHLELEIDFASDPDQAILLARETADALARDPAWRPRIIAEPEILGVERIGVNGYTLMMWIKMKPGAHWEVAREFRLRLLRCYRHHGIAFAAHREQQVDASGHQIRELLERGRITQQAS